MPDIGEGSKEFDAMVRDAIQFLQKKYQDAYVEGFVDGQDHGNLDYKYPPLGVAWLESETRRNNLELPLSDAQANEIKKWNEANYSDRCGTRVPLENISQPQPPEGGES